MNLTVFRFITISAPSPSPTPLAPSLPSPSLHYLVSFDLSANSFIDLICVSFPIGHSPPLGTCTFCFLFSNKPNILRSLIAPHSNYYSSRLDIHILLICSPSSGIAILPSVTSIVCSLLWQFALSLVQHLFLYKLPALL